MKSFALACAVLVGLVASAKAADVSKSTLNDMGFGAATIMSDADGLTVRGKGTSAGVWGASIANYNTYRGDNSALNGYEAAASHHHGSSYAKGSNLSFAGNINSHGFSVNFAGGTSKAYAR
ncbi:MAG: hypothetical protein AB7E98_02465 [Pirellulales bacterium]